jgi:hypothetical protein
MGAEAIIRDAVAPVSSAFAPTMVFMLPMLGAMVLPNLSRFRAPVCGPVGLAPIVSTMIVLAMIGLVTIALAMICPVVAPMRLRMVLPVLPVVFWTFLPVLALIVSPVVVPVLLPLMVVAPVLVRVLVRASVFLFVLVTVLSARGSSRTKSEDQRRCTEDRYDFHWAP